MISVASKVFRFLQYQRRWQNTQSFLPDFSLAKLVQLSVIVFSLLLAGCASFKSTSDSQSNKAVKLAPADALDTVTSPKFYQYFGRLSVSYANQVGELRHIYARFAFKDDDNKDENIQLELKTPIGNTLASISADRFHALLERPGKVAQTAADAELLMANTLGFVLPIRGMRSWLRALPSPYSSPNKWLRDKFGRTLFLEQDGWLIDYRYTTNRSVTAASSAMDAANNSRLTRLDLKRVEQNDNQPEFSIKLLLD